MSEPTAEVFESIVLRPMAPDVPGPALLSWSTMGLGDRTVQVYVNGLLADAIADAAISETWLHLDRIDRTAIELLAVDRTAMWVDHSDRLTGWPPPLALNASLGLVRDESLPADAEVVVTVDGEDGTASPLWSATDSRNGFGGLFGFGSFGLDDATGPGHGLGEFGVGPLGADGEAWRWRFDGIAPGDHALAIRVRSPTAGMIDAIDGLSVSIDTPPPPAESLSIDDSFTLTWA